MIIIVGMIINVEYMTVAYDTEPIRPPMSPPIPDEPITAVNTK